VPDGPCDTPWPLINATFEYIDKVWKDKIDFIVWTGDNARFFPPLFSRFNVDGTDMIMIIIFRVHRLIFLSIIELFGINSSTFLNRIIPFFH
jgi:hypothetical protein